MKYLLPETVRHAHVHDPFEASTLHGFPSFLLRSHCFLLSARRTWKILYARLKGNTLVRKLQVCSTLEAALEIHSFKRLVAKLDRHLLQETE